MIDFVKKYSEKITLALVACIVCVIYCVIDCPIKFITGISCMGCGMTRALLSAARFRFADSFYYHPLWPLVIVWVPIIIFRNKINKNVMRVLIVITVVAFLVAYFIRMFDGHNHIVVFEPMKGLFGRIIKY